MPLCQAPNVGSPLWLRRPNRKVSRTYKNRSMSEPLFPEPKTGRPEWNDLTEPRVNLVRTVTTDDVRKIRRNLNAWYELLPDDAKPRFAIELTSDADQHHQQAIDELFVFSRLRSMYPVVTVEEGGNGPDFRAYRDDELQVSAEVLTIFDYDEVTSTNAAWGRLADQLNAAFSAESYIAHIEAIRGSKTPKTEVLNSWVRQQMDALPTPDPNADLSSQLHRSTFSEQAGDETIEVDFAFIGVSTKGGRDFAGIGPFQSTVEGSAGRLLPALQQKVKKRYDARDKPMLLVAVLRQMFVRRYNLEVSAYGRELGATGSPLHGFFSNPTRNTRFSGIYTMRGMTDFAPESVRTFRFQNPNAQHPESTPTFAFESECSADLNGDCGAIEWNPTVPESHI